MLDLITALTPTTLYMLLFAVDYHAASALPIDAPSVNARHLNSAAVLHALLAVHYWPGF